LSIHVLDLTESGAIRIQAGTSGIRFTKATTWERNRCFWASLSRFQHVFRQPLWYRKGGGNARDLAPWRAAHPSWLAMQVRYLTDFPQKRKTTTKAAERPKVYFWQDKSLESP